MNGITSNGRHVHCAYLHMYALLSQKTFIIKHKFKDQAVKMSTCWKPSTKSFCLWGPCHRLNLKRWKLAVSKEYLLYKEELKKDISFRNILLFKHSIGILSHSSQTEIICLFICLLSSLQECPFEVGEILRSQETTKRIHGKQDIVQILTSFVGWPQCF